MNFSEKEFIEVNVEISYFNMLVVLLKDAKDSIDYFPSIVMPSIVPQKIDFKKEDLLVVAGFDCGVHEGCYFIEVNLYNFTTSKIIAFERITYGGDIEQAKQENNLIKVKNALAYKLMLRFFTNSFISEIQNYRKNNN